MGWANLVIFHASRWSCAIQMAILCLRSWWCGGEGVSSVTVNIGIQEIISTDKKKKTDHKSQLLAHQKHIKWHTNDKWHRPYFKTEYSTRCAYWIVLLHNHFRVWSYFLCWITAASVCNQPRKQHLACEEYIISRYF